MILSVLLVLLALCVAGYYLYRRPVRSVKPVDVVEPVVALVAEGTMRSKCGTTTRRVLSDPARVPLEDES